MKVWVIWDHSDYYGPDMVEICATAEIGHAIIEQRKLTDCTVEEQEVIAALPGTDKENN